MEIISKTVSFLFASSRCLYQLLLFSLEIIDVFAIYSSIRTEPRLVSRLTRKTLNDHFTLDVMVCD